MTSFLRDALPSEAFDSSGKFSHSLYTEHCRRSSALAEKVMAARDVSAIHHRARVLVDLQGVYLALLDWLKERDFPLESGLLLSRFAIHLLTSVVGSIRAKLIEEAGLGAISFEQLVDMVSKDRLEELSSTRAVVRLEPEIELFYAPSPLDELKAKLREKARAGSRDAADQLSDAESGFVNVHKSTRDYRFYDNFISCLKRDPLVQRWEVGFFNLGVREHGLQFFDEKEVDVRIAIRGVDSCVEGAVHSLCVVSSDQDFGPLHVRCANSGLRTFHADVAKFARPKNIGRQIRQLDGFIPTSVDPSWPMKLLMEACAPFAFYDLSQSEAEGLCRLHNRLNEVQISLHSTEDGGMSMRLYRPWRN